MKSPRKPRLTPDEELELWLGPSNRPLFKTAAKARAAWFANRDALMATFAQAGRRPQAWWTFETAFDEYPGYKVETVFLFEHDLLTPAELAELLPRWREVFDEVNAPGWSGECAGIDEHGQAIWKRGVEGRTMMYEWAQIPGPCLRSGRPGSRGLLASIRPTEELFQCRHCRSA